MSGGEEAEANGVVAGKGTTEGIGVTAGGGALGARAGEAPGEDTDVTAGAREGTGEDTDVTAGGEGAL